MLDIIDNNYTVVGYKSSRHSFSLCVGTTSNKASSAAKISKTYKTNQVVDLVTGKIFEVIG
mgnify:CR=1 FL=1